MSDLERRGPGKPRQPERVYEQTAYSPMRRQPVDAESGDGAQASQWEAPTGFTNPPIMRGRVDSQRSERSRAPGRTQDLDARRTERLQRLHGTRELPVFTPSRIETTKVLREHKLTAAQIEAHDLRVYFVHKDSPRNPLAIRRFPGEIAREKLKDFGYVGPDINDMVAEERIVPRIRDTVAGWNQPTAREILASGPPSRTGSRQSRGAALPEEGEEGVPITQLHVTGSLQKKLEEGAVPTQFTLPDGTVVHAFHDSITNELHAVGKPADRDPLRNRTLPKRQVLQKPIRRDGPIDPDRRSLLEKIILSGKIVLAAGIGSGLLAAGYGIEQALSHQPDSSSKPPPKKNPFKHSTPGTK